MTHIRTPVKEKAKEIAKLLKKENPDYNYLRELFRNLRRELNVSSSPVQRKLPYIPTEEEIKKFYNAVWNSKNMKDVLIIKTLLYTAVRVSELVNIKLDDIDDKNFQIHIRNGVRNKSRFVPYPQNFNTVFVYHIDQMRKNGSEYLFESGLKKPYSDRGIRKMLQKYTKQAEISHSISPQTLRHFLFSWLKKQGLDDYLIQPFSGHESKLALEIYTSYSTDDAKPNYEQLIKNFPV